MIRLPLVRFHFSLLALAMLLLGSVGPVSADEKPAPRSLESLAAPEMPGIIGTAFGVTRKGTPLPVWLDEAALKPRSDKRHLLLIGGLDGSPAGMASARVAFQWFHRDEQAAPLRKLYSVSLIPCGNPDGWIAGSGPANQSDGNPTADYPPRGTAYNSPTDPEAAYLWRWLGMLGPDLVIEIREAETFRWVFPVEQAKSEPWKSMTQGLKPVRLLETGNDLVSQLPKNSPANVGVIPAVRVDVTTESDDFLSPLITSLGTVENWKPSPARQELISRANRSALQIAEQLSQRYGQNLPEVAYIPAVALIGRIRLGELTANPKHLADVEKIVQPYVSGDRESLPQQSSGSTHSGHLIFSELHRVTGKQAYGDLAVKAAELGFVDGQPKPSMPAHSEMSDSVFMGCPILAAAGRITGDARFPAMAVRHLQFMLKLNLREDGLHQHSPLDPTAWGRGNGFPALGLALSLADLPNDDPGRAVVLEAYRHHLRALIQHQDPTGMWHQIVDHPESYRELSSTCMITYAMTRGVREGWLDHDDFVPHIKAGWEAIKLRVAADGGLIDVCTGTGKQKSERDYFDRPAILGPDSRGGAMALLVATEIAAWERDQK